MIKVVFITLNCIITEGNGPNSGAEFMRKGSTYRYLSKLYQKGEITKERLLTDTFACWKGLSREKLPKVYERFELRPGVRETLGQIRSMGILTILISDIPMHLALRFRDDLQFDHVIGTELEILNDAFTGRVTKFHDDSSQEVLNMMKSLGIRAKEAIAVGNSKEDEDLFKLVQFGVVLDGDEVTRKGARYVITHFDELLPIIEKELYDPDL